jgi:hypothetical protein
MNTGTNRGSRTGVNPRAPNLALVQMEKPKGPWDQALLSRLTKPMSANEAPESPNGGAERRAILAAPCHAT